jgi:hypothetical protein
MRIVEDSPQRLVLRDQSIWITAICVVASAFLLYELYINQEIGTQAAIVLFFALFGFAFLRISNIEFDKVSQVCILNKFSVFKGIRLTIRFADITDIKIDIEPLTDSQRENCRLSLATASGMIPLSDIYQPDIKRYNEIRNTILEALGKQEALASQPDPVQSLIQQGGIIDAVALLRQRENLDLEAARKRVDEIRKLENKD